jgi:hypothetical protein
MMQMNHFVPNNYTVFVRYSHDFVITTIFITEFHYIYFLLVTKVSFRFEDCSQKVFHFVIASYLKFQKWKVPNEVQSNKIDRGASTAVSVSYIHITKLDATTVKIPF